MCFFWRENSTLPALDADYIKPFALEQTHRVNNGILLRKDIHALFDTGYITITPEFRIEVSRKIKEEFENGRDYYRFHGDVMGMPVQPDFKPDVEVLSWHNQEVFKG